MDFAVRADNRREIKESEKIQKYLDLTREQKSMEHQNDGDTNCSCCTWNGPQRIEEEIRTEHQRKNQDHSNYNIVEIGQKYPEESWSLGDLNVSHSDSSGRPPTNAGEKNSQLLK